MRHCSIALLVALAVPATALTATEPPIQQSTTLWSAAKKFFGMREHMKAKVDSTKAGTAVSQLVDSSTSELDQTFP